MFFNFILLTFLSFLTCTFTANILVLENTPSPSHHIWIRSLTVELANSGHNVTSLSADIDSTQTKNLHYLHLEKVYPSLYNGTEDVDFIKDGELNHWFGFTFLFDYSLSTCIGTLESKGFKDLLNYPDDFKFDLILYDYLIHPCTLGFLHKFKYPPLLALTGSYAVYTTSPLVGSMYYPYTPHLLMNKFTNSFFGRVETFLMYGADQMYRHFVMNPKLDKLTAVHFPDVPKVSNLEKLTRLVLINHDPIFEDGEPILPNVIPVGGMQIKTPKELPSDLKWIADRAKNSLVLFSLGTNMRSDKLGDARLTEILKGFESLPQLTFLWKFESDKLPMKVPENVYIRAWIPQTDILAHPNTILFITHAGLLSTQEAIWYGVPMLGIPIFMDQFLNIEKVIKVGVAEKLYIQNLSANTLANSIANIHRNPKYHENMKKLSSNYRDQPETPIQRAVWWTEWLLRNSDTNYFKNPTLNMNYFQREMIDVIGFLTIIFLILFIILIKLTVIVIKILLQREQVYAVHKQKNN